MLRGGVLRVRKIFDVVQKFVQLCTAPPARTLKGVHHDVEGHLSQIIQTYFKKSVDRYSSGCYCGHLAKRWARSYNHGGFMLPASTESVIT